MKTGLYSNDIILELDNIKKLTEKFNNPQNDLKFIHVAGTNGKGSVCAFLESVLKVSGFVCGKFTSPEIRDVTDSISVNGENIKKDELSALFLKSKSAYNKASDFEHLVNCAFLYFKEKKCDFVILETGLGGIGDATNIIDAPLYSIICKISIDHTNFLGNTIEEIAEKKAGIIKKNSKTVTLKTQDENALSVISKKCALENNTLILTKTPEIYPPIGISEHFSYLGLDIVSGLSGFYQIDNISLAIEVLKDLKIPDEFIIKGIKDAKHPARFEALSENLIFDGAHNPDGVESFLSSLSRYFPNTKKNLIIGMMRDKDINTVIELLKKYNEDKLSEIFTVEVLNNPRSANSSELEKEFIKNGFSVTNAKTLKNALNIIKKDRLTAVFGSLYLYKEFFI